MPDMTPHGEPTLTKFQDQAIRYMEACYGKAVWFRAPETFDNMLERWLHALAGGNVEAAETYMADIEAKAKTLPGGRLRA